jgi:hypothetical protein
MAYQSSSGSIDNSLTSRYVSQTMSKWKMIFCFIPSVSLSVVSIANNILHSLIELPLMITHTTYDQLQHSLHHQTCICFLTVNPVFLRFYDVVIPEIDGSYVINLTCL